MRDGQEPALSTAPGPREPPGGAPALPPRLRWVLDEGPRGTVFVELPGGTFAMGSDDGRDEGPRREVSVGPFAVALAPVSNAEFAHFLAAGEHEPPRFWDEPRFHAAIQPVVGVSWFDAGAYCDWLGELLGRRCRLPTEAEREYAARGGAAELAYPWGDDPLTEGAFAYGAAGTDRPLSLGSVEPNGYGLYHMCENVHEWCSDWYEPGYDPAAVTDPRGPAEGTRRASRGGSWRHRVKVSRITARSSLAPESRYNDYGLRVYADAPAP